jgi:SAM-dependent methyltransferase
MDPDRLYDEAFFAMHVAWRAEYELIGDALVGSIGFSSALDLGCGNAFLIAWLAERGKKVAGVEGSRAAFGLFPAPSVAQCVSPTCAVGSSSAVTTW